MFSRTEPKKHDKASYFPENKTKEHKDKELTSDTVPFLSPINGLVFLPYFFDNPISHIFSLC